MAEPRRARTLDKCAAFAADSAAGHQHGDTSISGAGTAIVVISVIGLVMWTIAYHMLCGRESG